MGYIEDLRKIVGHRPLILVGSVVIVRNQLGQVLLQQRLEPHGVWGLPGGLMELGESVEDTARREVFEETGLRLGALSLVGVFSGPDYFVRAQNGDEFYVVTNGFVTTEYSGTLIADENESLSLSFFDINAMPPRMVGSHVRIVKAYLQSQTT